VNSQTYSYLLLYLTPERLIKKSKLLQLQWNNIKTLIPCFLESLFTGDVEVKLHDLDKVFAGIIKLEDYPKGYNVLGKVASLWYYLTKVFHQFIGPRVGNFAEELIVHWIENGGVYKVVGRNVTLKKALEELAEVNVEKRNRVDLVLRSKGKERAALVEIRMSEHTGGRTAQQSLLDKIDSILELLEDEKTTLREKLLKQGTRELDLTIAILFNENHELLTKSNYNRGRLTSLVSYIMDNRHVWGMLKKLANTYEYRLCDGTPMTDDTKAEIETELLNPDGRRVCIQDSSSSLKIELKILFGDEFFTEYAGASLRDLLARYGNIIADDIWLFYTIVINELKVAAQFKQTNVRRLYEDLLGSNIFRQFITNIYGKTGLSLSKYVHHLNQWSENCANTVIKIYKEKGEELKLLETSDLVANFEYLKQLCLCSLVEYIAINHKLGREFQECRWK